MKVGDLVRYNGKRMRMGIVTKVVNRKGRWGTRTVVICTEALASEKDKE